MELTKRLTEGSAGAGTAGGQQIDGEGLWAPKLKKTCITSGCYLQHFPKTMKIFEEHFGFIEIPILI